LAPQTGRPFSNAQPRSLSPTLNEPARYQN
jgi:hypothetical protein